MVSVSECHPSRRHATPFTNVHQHASGSSSSSPSHNSHVQTLYYPEHAHYGQVRHQPTYLQVVRRQQVLQWSHPILDKNSSSSIDSTHDGYAHSKGHSRLRVIEPLNGNHHHTMTSFSSSNFAGNTAASHPDHSNDVSGTTTSDLDLPPDVRKVGFMRKLKVRMTLLPLPLLGGVVAH